MGNFDSPLRFIDLFAGIGGMRLGFEQAGCRCVFSSEWNRFSRRTYEANFHEQPAGDITKIAATDIPTHEILVAGFPCQPFSIAGVAKKRSLGRPTGFADQTQGTLFFDICRILQAKRPQAFLLENVKNLRSHDRGRTFTIIQEALSALDYAVFAQVIDGQAYVPQHRERIFIVGFDVRCFGRELSFDFALQPPARPLVLREILEPIVPDKYTLTDHLWQYLKAYAQKHQASGNGFGYSLADFNGVTRTLSARYYKDGSEILIAQSGRNPRRLTPRECARLQGFPDSFEIPVSDTQAYRQFGNSVVVPLVADLARLMVAKLTALAQGRTEPHQLSLLPLIEPPDFISPLSSCSFPQKLTHLHGY
ncbi:MAG: DNA (cytosine-5-)-methyltransferase [Anaerobiospirillum sp.]|nr:DNA (cytosine-5-)-methyltransferase [Anaerobiospirillum sp.]